MSIRIDTCENIDNQHAVFDVNQQLKRQSDQAKRFVNSAIKEHPQLENIKGALQVLQPKQLISVLENTRSAINGQGDKVNLSSHDMPVLVEPDDVTSAKSINHSARMLALLGKISQLTSDSSLQKQLIQLKSYNASMSGAENRYSEIAKLLESHGEQWATDYDVLKVATAESSQLEDDVNSAESDLKNARAKLSKLETEAQGKNPVPPKLSQKIDDAHKEVMAAQVVADKSMQAFNQHTITVLNPAVRAENASKTALDNTLVKADVVTRGVPLHQQLAVENQRKQNDQLSKNLDFLIAVMSQLIEQSASENLKASAELKNKLSEAAAKESEHKAKQYEDALRKSEDLQKVMGCIGKTLGWVITGISFAAAIFTGGASLAFAAIGLALTVGDEINQAVNGTSFMVEAMKPLMEAIVQPLMELLGSACTKILEALGVDKDTAKMVGQIMGAIAAAVIMVAAVMVAGSIASKLSSVVAKKVGTNVMSKVMNNVVSDAIKRMGQGIGRTIGMEEAKIAQVALRSEMALSAATMANTALHTTGNIVTADMKIDAAKIKAQLLNNMVLQDLLNEMLERAVESFKMKIESTNAIIKNISSVIENRTQAGIFITKQMGTAAG